MESTKTIENVESSMPQSSWITFIHNNEHSLRHIQDSEKEARIEQPKKLESEALNEALSSILTSLAYPPESSDAPLKNDLQSIKKLTDAIVNAQKEDVLTEPEALALVKFIIAKFAERRVGRALRRMLPTGESKQWFYGSRKLIR